MHTLYIHAGLHHGLPNSEMDLVAFRQGESDGETRIDAHRGARAYEKVTAGEIPCDGRCFLLGEVAWPLARAEGRRGRARKRVVVVIVMRMTEVVHRRGVRHGGRRERD